MSHYIAEVPLSIPVNVLQMLKKDISKPLSRIFNLSMRTSTHPDCLKLDMVRPIHKVPNSNSVATDASRSCQTSID